MSSGTDRRRHRPPGRRRKHPEVATSYASRTSPPRTIMPCGRSRNGCGTVMRYLAIRRSTSDAAWAWVSPWAAASPSSWRDGTKHSMPSRSSATARSTPCCLSGGRRTPSTSRISSTAATTRPETFSVERHPRRIPRISLSVLLRRRAGRHRRGGHRRRLSAPRHRAGVREQDDSAFVWWRCCRRDTSAQEAAD